MKISPFLILRTIEVGFSTCFPRYFQILSKHVTDKYCQNNADWTKITDEILKLTALV